MKKIALLLLTLALGVAPLRLWSSETSLKPNEALEKLIQGNQRFVAGQNTHPNIDETRRNQVASGQTPFAVILGCADSRVPPETIFDQGLGDLFSVRVAGNTLDDIILGSVEYATKVLHSPLIVVLGHQKCGAVEAALSKEEKPGHIGFITDEIKTAMKTVTCDPKDQPTCAIRANVTWVVDELNKSTPILKPLIDEGKLRVVGAYYNLETGKVEFLGEKR